MTSVAETSISLLDLKAQHRGIRDEVIAAALRVIDSQKFILGDEGRHLENEIAEYCGVERAVGCASGSDALFLALLALDIGPGDSVLTTPYTFFATVGAICRAGATPVFVDVCESTFNMDMAKVGPALDEHQNVRALIPIHLFGGCADMDPLMDIAARRGIMVIEDAAQAIGAEYKGRRAGGMGCAGCFSFFPSKNLGAFGDGGMLTTNDAGLAERLAALRVHGSREKYHHEWIGVNSRLDEIQAAVLRVKLKYLDSWTGQRQANADLYRRFLSEMNLPIIVPEAAPYQSRHIYNQFVIRAPNRNALQAHLRGQGIGTEVYYPVPLHLQKCFEHLPYRAGDLPVSERLAAESLALPIYAEVGQERILRICEAIRDFYSGR